MDDGSGMPIVLAAGGLWLVWHTLCNRTKAAQAEAAGADGAAPTPNPIARRRRNVSPIAGPTDISFTGEGYVVIDNTRGDKTAVSAESQQGGVALEGPGPGSRHVFTDETVTGGYAPSVYSFDKWLPNRCMLDDPSQTTWHPLIAEQGTTTNGMGRTDLYSRHGRTITGLVS